MAKRNGNSTVATEANVEAEIEAHGTKQELKAPRVTVEKREALAIIDFSDRGKKPAKRGKPKYGVHVQSIEDDSPRINARFVSHSHARTWAEVLARADRDLVIVIR